MEGSQVVAGEWIKLRNDIHTDPAVIEIANRTGLDEFAVVGRLSRLWAWASEHLSDGNAPSVTEKWIDRYVCHAGFAQAMVSARWLTVVDGGICIPNFDRHMSKNAKTRALSKDRTQKHRNAPSVTEALPEKRREEKRRNNNPPCPPSGGNELPKIPETLDTPEFRAAWGDWIQHRKERKPKVTPKSAELAFKSLEAMGMERAIRAIRHSIAGGYQGIFEPSSGVPPPGRKLRPTDPGFYDGIKDFANAKVDQ